MKNHLFKDQKLCLSEKINLSKKIICEWIESNNGNVFVSFSGGKDSTVLLDLVSQIDDTIPAVFFDTGMEYPEIIDFISEMDNIIWIKDDIDYKEIFETYGYPVINKSFICAYEKGEILDEKYYSLIKNAPFKVSNECCRLIKGKKIEKYINETGRLPIVAVMASESYGRTKKIIKYGYNAKQMSIPTSHPLGFWNEKDVLEYIEINSLRHCRIYDDKSEFAEKRTNCMYCLYGVQNENEPNKFQRMKRTHREQYDYAINTLGLGKILDYLNINYE